MIAGIRKTFPLTLCHFYKYLIINTLRKYISDLCVRIRYSYCAMANSDRDSTKIRRIKRLLDKIVANPIIF